MYAGSKPFSEKESQALANLLNKTKDDVIAYVSLHNFGQAWMTPYGHVKNRPDRYKELVRKYSILLSKQGLSFTQTPTCKTILVTDYRFRSYGLLIIVPNIQQTTFFRCPYNVSKIQITL